MSVTVPTKDVGEVKDVKNKNASYKEQLEDRGEEYIRRQLHLILGKGGGHNVWWRYKEFL